MDKEMQVKDLPEELREACLWRGLDQAQWITFRNAISEWSAFELGDPCWGSLMARLYDEFRTDLKSQT